ncbi:SDR family oxidoreductase [Micromonospora polyrhachis]|uniref:NAD(P)-dependent dehydrogenase (Short-subunit alcohol dehydrogenase family) n=1 Tax=Micromonospora polyrhachis TaxID=1282883 RepID=A0A7W7SN93_9ACTN|nr:SDR family oxidoreductase [Micromonospora polyrhachis]MBB4957914.1 NAD(P)-dependent dehydrogenase (short-subunit alcohol dehydrogenase family) [Micromonospora polyrhachis]
MGTYAVTGAASGMGKAAAERLRGDGHSVIGVDLRNVEVIADLSTPQGRAAAAAEVLDRAGGRLDGAVCAAGLGGIPGRDSLVQQVNYFGVVDLLEAWRPALAAAGNSKVVVFGSNSVTLTPMVPEKAVRALLDRKPAKALRVVGRFGKRSAPFAYASSKLAVTRWARRAAISPQWAGAGIRVNILAPGIIATPLLDEQIARGEKASVEQLAVPIGGRGNPKDVGEWVAFMLSPAADFLCGSVIFLDGGSDAYFRTDDWPVSTGPAGVIRYMRRAKAWRNRH